MTNYHIPNEALNNQIDHFLFIAEAAERWGISENTIKGRLKLNFISDKTKKDLAYLESLGYLKYFCPKGGKRGSWLLTTNLMHLWYGEELPKEKQSSQIY